MKIENYKENQNNLISDWINKYSRLFNYNQNIKSLNIQLCKLDLKINIINNIIDIIQEYINNINQEK